MDGSELEGAAEEEGGRKPPQEECECQEGAPEWVVTFGDLMSLLLTFFVLLLSFSRMDQERFKEVAGSLRDAFGVQRLVPVFDLPRGIDLIARDFNASFSSEILEKKIKAAIKRLKKEAEEGDEEEKEGPETEGGVEEARDPAGGVEGPLDAMIADALEAGELGPAETGELDPASPEVSEIDFEALAQAIEIEETATAYIIRLDGAALFESGQGALRPEGELLLRALQPAVLDFGGEILVEGHTDDQPFAGHAPGPNDGNWQLSFDRAHRVGTYLHEQLGIDLGRIGMIARGPSRPRVANATPEGRARNRRVEIVLQKEITEAPPPRIASLEPERPAAPPMPDPAEELDPLPLPKAPPPAKSIGETAIPEMNFSPLEQTDYIFEAPKLFPD